MVFVCTMPLLNKAGNSPVFIIAIIAITIAGKPIIKVKVMSRIMAINLLPRSALLTCPCGS